MGGDIGEIYKYINHHPVVTKASSKIILVQVYIIFALPDYGGSEVIERHQNLLYGRLIPLALEFDLSRSPLSSTVSVIPFSYLCVRF